MPRVIKVTVPDETYDRLVKKRKAAGLPSIAALLLHKVGELDDAAEAQEIVKRAMAKAKRQVAGKPYGVRDLFTREEWEEFSKSARLMAGKMLFAKVEQAVDGISPSGKSSSGHQLYKTAKKA